MRFLVLLTCLSAFLPACQKRGSDASRPSDLSGEELARLHCGSCHQMPAPELLDKQTWKKGVLPRMALRLGMDPNLMTTLMSLPSEEMDTFLLAGVYPTTPVMHPADWQKIVDYYETLAPEKLPSQPAKRAVAAALPLFRVDSSLTWLPPQASMIRYDPRRHRFLVGMRNAELYVLDQHFKPTDSLWTQTTPSDVHIGADGSLDILTMGIMDPNDRRKGALLHFRDQNTTQPDRLLQKLHRPVQQLRADLNGDGREDVLICEFGNVLGKLAWYEKQEGGTFREHRLDYAPGARMAQLHDFNRDGKLDIMVLFAQGDESIAFYYNRGNGLFEKTTALRFPPVYGSGSAELVDINRDGHVDILYVNGDNADFSPVLKPYHGLRIFLNDGRNHFRQSWFYPMHGASKAIADDFDGDGDVDLAAISFFPNPKSRPAEGFLYFENRGKAGFFPQTFAANHRGNWMLLERADYDGDGDTDLLLGNFAAPRFRSTQNRNAGIWVLQNRQNDRSTIRPSPRSAAAD